MNQNISKPTAVASGTARAYGGFLENLPLLGKLTSSCKTARVVDPLKRMRSTFAAHAQMQIDIIQSGKHRDGRRWFKRIDAEGIVNVSR